jgi:hypothetical protein
MTIGYYAVTIPFAIFVWEFNEYQFWAYVWQGFLIDLIIAYPIGKMIIYVNSKLKKILSI